MVTPLHRDEVRHLVDRGGQLVEGLPAAEYDDEHLPGAVNMPLRSLGRDAAALDRSQPVVVYCWDAL